MADENVVKLERRRRLDLRGNNRFRDLLETHAEQSAVIAEATKLKKAADAEIRAVLGDAEAAIADGFLVTVTSFERAEYVVPARTVHRMMIRAKGR